VGPSPLTHAAGSEGDTLEIRSVKRRNWWLAVAIDYLLHRIRERTGDHSGAETSPIPGTAAV
jgi:hypothetical protein